MAFDARVSDHGRTRPIKLSSPDIGGEERRLVDEVLRTGQLSNGPVLASFEREFAARLGVRHAVAVSSGTAALHLSMIVAGVGDGLSVLTTPFSFVASANAILYERATPLFIDIDPATLTMDAEAAVDAISSLAGGGKLRAVLPVHIFGRPTEMEPIVSVARRHGVAVIEDACEALGAMLDSVPMGRWGDAAAFGFYPNKQITTGEGGMLVTDRDDWARLARSLRNQGRSDDGSWLHHERLGYNYRMDDLSAAVGLAQLRRLDELMAKRAAVAARYDEWFRGHETVTPLPRERAGMRVSWFVYSVRLAAGLDRDQLMARLDARGIPSRPYFPSIHLMPFYRQRFGFRAGMFPHSEAASASLLALPFHAGLCEADIERVAAALLEEVRALKAAS